MRKSKKIPKSKPYRLSISEESLRRKMSKVISLRERVAQAELAAGVLRLMEDHAAELVLNELVLNELVLKVKAK